MLTCTICTGQLGGVGRKGDEIIQSPAPLAAAEGQRHHQHVRRLGVAEHPAAHQIGVGPHHAAGQDEQLIDIIFLAGQIKAVPPWFVVLHRSSSPVNFRRGIPYQIPPKSARAELFQFT